VKKILGLTIAIVLIIGLVAGGTWAYFSDTETVVGNSFTAGTIDLAMSGKVTIPDIKPCMTEWGYIHLRNAGDNDGNTWLHFANVMNYENNIVDPEAEAYWENSSYNPDKLRYDNFLECFTTIDIYIDPEPDGEVTNGGTYVIQQSDGWELAELECQWIPLGELKKNEKVEVWFSFHIQPDVGNEFQSDEVVFDLEVMLQQANATTVPEPEWPSQMRVLRLENKDSSQATPTSAADMVGKNYWTPITGDGIYAILSYDSKGHNFDYTLTATGLADGNYSLIYYADPWPGSNGCLINTMSAVGGAINQTGSVDLGMDLPTSGDANYPDGAKIWLVPSDDYSGSQITGWNPDDFLFEMRLITYNDTDV